MSLRIGMPDSDVLKFVRLKAMQRAWENGAPREVSLIAKKSGGIGVRALGLHIQEELRKTSAHMKNCEFATQHHVTSLEPQKGCLGRSTVADEEEMRF